MRHYQDFIHKNRDRAESLAYKYTLKIRAVLDHIYVFKDLHLDFKYLV